MSVLLTFRRRGAARKGVDLVLFESQLVVITVLQLETQVMFELYHKPSGMLKLVHGPQAVSFHRNHVLRWRARAPSFAEVHKAVEGYMQLGSTHAQVQ